MFLQPYSGTHRLMTSSSASSGLSPDSSSFPDTTTGRMEEKKMTPMPQSAMDVMQQSNTPRGGKVAAILALLPSLDAAGLKKVIDVSGEILVKIQSKNDQEDTLVQKTVDELTKAINAKRWEEVTSITTHMSGDRTFTPEIKSRILEQLSGVLDQAVRQAAYTTGQQTEYDEQGIFSLSQLMLGHPIFFTTLSNVISDYQNGIGRFTSDSNTFQIINAITLMIILGKEDPLMLDARCATINAILTRKDVLPDTPVAPLIRKVIGTGPVVLFSHPTPPKGCNIPAADYTKMRQNFMDYIATQLQSRQQPSKFLNQLMNLPNTFPADGKEFFTQIIAKASPEVSYALKETILAFMQHCYTSSALMREVCPGMYDGVYEGDL